MATPIKSVIGLSAVALSAISLSSTASAETGAAESVSQTVEYSDLNLASAEGQKRLESRIKSAVRSICSNNRRVTLTERRLENQCQAQAMQAAMDDAKVAIANYKSDRRVASNMLTVRTRR